jgi:tetratricopeptide (TPR) repeat protein
LKRLSYSKHRWIGAIIVVFSVLNFTACSMSFSSLEFHRGKKAAEEQDFKAALEHFQKVIRRSPESDNALAAAREASRIAFYETKQFGEAVQFYRYLIGFSPIEQERRKSQVKIADIYFENINDYPQAIEEYNKLLLLRNSNEEIVDLRSKLARANFYLHRFAEAQLEIEGALKIVENPDRKFELRMLLGNLYFNTKRAEEAIRVYETVVRDYPERAQKDNVVMNMIVCYEDMEAFDKAIEKLSSIKSNYPDPEFIELKIKRLKERKANLPGSRGLRK